MESQSLLHQGIECDDLCCPVHVAFSPSQSLLHQGIECDLQKVCLYSSRNPFFIRALNAT
jgi:hypothetical protein